MVKDLSHQDRNEMFWFNDIWQKLPNKALDTDLFSIVLNKNFLNSSLYNVDLISTCATLYSAVFTRAVKTSKIFIENESNLLY